MADNTELDPGTGGDVVRTKDRTTSKLQIVGIDLAPGGVESLMNGTMPVSAASLPLPTGAGTSAKQDTIIGHLDGVEGLLTTIDADTSALAGAVAGTEVQVDVLTVPADPFGANADAAATAGSTGSIQAKLRLMTSQLDAIKTAVETLDNAIGGSEMQVDVITLPALPAGTNNIGDVDVLTIAAGTNAIGNVGIVPRTSGGLTTYHLVSAGSTNATVVKNGAGQLFGWYITNTNAAARKLAFHNASSTPTAGASVFFSLVIPAGSAANVFVEAGIAFSTGISITTVTEAADAGTTGVGAGDLIINLWYA